MSNLKLILDSKQIAKIVPESESTFDASSRQSVSMSTLASHLNTLYGYSCQAWLAVSIAERYFSSRHRVWFATTLNPRYNGLSSNPLGLFQELSTIVSTNDRYHSRIAQLRDRLAAWIAASTLSADDVSELLAEITAAPVIAFRPQLWRVNLSYIHISRLVNLGQFPDEYQISDLISPEFDLLSL